MNAPLLGAVPAVLIALLVGYGIYWSVAPKGRPITPIQLGRKWYAWFALVNTVVFFPRLLYQPFTINNFAIWWILGLMLEGGIVFLVGWLVGKVRFRRTAVQPSAVAVTADD